MNTGLVRSGAQINISHHHRCFWTKMQIWDILEWTATVNNEEEIE